MSQRFLWRPAVHRKSPLRKQFIAPFTVGQETGISRTKLFYRHFLKFCRKADETLDVLMFQRTTLSSVKELSLDRWERGTGLIT